MREYLYRVATDEKNGAPEALLKPFLLLLSFIYGVAAWKIRFFYRIKLLKQKKLPKPVISIGNITLGGVGKTPLVMLIAQYLKKKGLKPAILTRGYMGEGAKAASDEAQLLKELGVPVIVGRNRFEAAQEALKKENIDVFLLDDGFQHWCLARDLDIVLIDAAKPFGNGCLFPRGILREPLSALKRAGVFVLTKTDFSCDIETMRKQLKAINPSAPIIETIHAPVRLKDLKENKTVELPFLQNKNVVAVSGIGDPASFDHLLKHLGAKVSKHFSFLDHHNYKANDVARIAEFAKKENIEICLTTDKDAVKLKKFISESDLCYLSLQIKIEIVKGEDEFFRRISSNLHR